MIRIILLALIVPIVAGQCSFPDALLGDWTSSNYGLLTFSNSTPHFEMKEFGLWNGLTTTEFDCLFTNGTQYILKSIQTFAAFDGQFNVHAYMCLDVRQSGVYSYYYYQNSDTETSFKGQRAKGLQPTVTVENSSQVCNASLVDMAEFHSMIKVGFEGEAVVQCPDPLLLSATYTYTDSTGTYCNGTNTTMVDSCSDTLNRTGAFIQFNETLITDTTCSNKNPGYSADGLLGCVTNIYDSTRQQYYVSLYNYDAVISNPTTYRYTCIAVMSDTNGTVFLSMSPNDCVAGQTANVLLTPGALMEFTPSGIPVDVGSPADWTWLIILCVLLFLLLVAILIVVLVCLYVKKKQREKAREKKILITEEHPLAEVSMPLDAPSSMEPVNDTAFLEMREEMFRTPRGKKKEKPMMNPMSESSMILDFKSPRWSSNKGPKPSIPDDPFSEMSNGEIVPISPVGSKAHRSMLNYNQRYYRSSFLESNPNPVINGELIRRASERSLNKERASESSLNKDYDVRSRPATQRSGFSQTARERAPSLRNGIPRTPRSERAPSRKHPSVAPPSPRQRIEHAPSVAPIITKNKAPSVAPSTKSNKISKSKTVPSAKPKSGKRVSRTQGVVSTKLVRGTTSTKLGSVTHRDNPPSKGKVRRSKTMVEPPIHTIAKAKEGEKIEISAMNEFLAAETGSTAGVSDTGQSKKSVPRRKSILKKKSAYFPVDLEDEIVEEQRFPTIPHTSDSTYEHNGSENMNELNENNGDVTGDKIHDISADMALSLSARDSFLDVKAREHMAKKASKPVPSKTPWH